MTKTTKYCMHPVEDGRCGKPFTTYSIRSSRRYCDEHELKVGQNVRIGNTYSKVQTQEEMRKYVMSEMNSQAMTRGELGLKISTTANRINKRIDVLHDIVADITTSDMEGYTIKKHQTMKNIIEDRIDILFERNLVTLSTDDKIMEYITKMNQRIKVLEISLDKAYEIIESNKTGRKSKKRKVK